MKKEYIAEALSGISDRHIAEAAPKKRHFWPIAGAIAAGLALALTVGFWFGGQADNAMDFVSSNNTNGGVQMETPESPLLDELIPVFNPETVCPDKLLATAQYPALLPFPTDQSDYDAWANDHSRWSDARNRLHTAPEGYADNLKAFWQASITQCLTGQGDENGVCSPISLYMALSMLAQVTGGNSQQELLALLGAKNGQQLREQTKLIFENHYENDGMHTSIFANSLWLDDAYEFNTDAVRFLSENCYASIYQGALETPEMNIALKDWLNAQTGGLLQDSIQDLDTMDERTALAIASTVNYRCKWTAEFYEKFNTQGTFHSPEGPQEVTYLNGDAGYAPYYWGEGFSGTYKALDDGSRMWLILPDEGLTPSDLLESGNAMDMILNDENYTNTKQALINLTVPKFDICADLDLTAGLKNLGITQVTDPTAADFSGIESYEQYLYLSTAKQSARVSIDEQGVTGVAFTLMVAPGAGAPPTEIVDLIFDRPFLFVVESGDGLPLFAGIVCNP